jgi:hypothetical protein
MLTSTLKIVFRFYVTRINSGAGIRSTMSAFVSFATESLTDVKSKSGALLMVNMSCIVRLKGATQKRISGFIQELR